MERTVALKVLNSDDPNLLERFKREIKTTAKLHHPNIISIFEAGRTDDGKIFYAMEYLAGETLRDILEREGRLRAGRVHNVMQQLAAAVGAAHSMGIVHRNLNPDDLVIAQQAGNPDFCTILDFGVARILESESELTMRGEILGQPEYLAPETLNDDEVAPSVDIYAIGCIAYECLVGQPPFRARPRMVTVWMHATDPVPPFPQEVVASTPPELLQTVLWMLEKDPTMRPRDGLELAQRLETIPYSDFGDLVDVADPVTGFSLDSGPTVITPRAEFAGESVAFGAPTELPPLAGFVEESPSAGPEPSDTNNPSYPIEVADFGSSLPIAPGEPSPFPPAQPEPPPLFDESSTQDNLIDAFAFRPQDSGNSSATLPIPSVTADDVPDFFKLPSTTPSSVHVPPPSPVAPPSPVPPPSFGTAASQPSMSDNGAPAPPAPEQNSESRDADRDRALASFANRAAAARPHSRRPLAKGKLASGGKSCSFTVRAGDFDTLVGTALAGAARMSLAVGVQVVVQIPVDRHGRQQIHVGGVVTRTVGAPPELVIAVNEVDDTGLFETMVSRWLAR